MADRATARLYDGDVTDVPPQRRDRKRRRCSSAAPVRSDSSESGPHSPIDHEYIVDRRHKFLRIPVDAEMESITINIKFKGSDHDHKIVIPRPITAESSQTGREDDATGAEATGAEATGAESSQTGREDDATGAEATGADSDQATGAEPGPQTRIARINTVRIRSGSLQSGVTQRGPQELTQTRLGADSDEAWINCGAAGGIIDDICRSAQDEAASLDSFCRSAHDEAASLDILCRSAQDSAASLDDEDDILDVDTLIDQSKKRRMRVLRALDVVRAIRAEMPPGPGGDPRRRSVLPPGWMPPPSNIAANGLSACSSAACVRFVNHAELTTCCWMCADVYQEGHTKECAARQRQLRTMILLELSFKGKGKGKGKGMHKSQQATAPLRWPQAWGE